MGVLGRGNRAKSVKVVEEHRCVLKSERDGAYARLIHRENASPLDNEVRKYARRERFRARCVARRMGYMSGLIEEKTVCQRDTRVVVKISVKREPLALAQGNFPFVVQHEL